MTEIFHCRPVVVVRRIFAYFNSTISYQLTLVRHRATITNNHYDWGQFMWQRFSVVVPLLYFEGFLPTSEYRLQGEFNWTARTCPIVRDTRRRLLSAFRAGGPLTSYNSCSSGHDTSTPCMLWTAVTSSTCNVRYTTRSSDDIWFVTLHVTAPVLLPKGKN